MSLNINNVSGKGINNPVPLDVNFGQSGLLPIDLFPRIFQDLKVDLPSVAMVCKNWKALADDETFCKMIRPAQAFGVQEWKEYIGVDVGDEPRLPRRAYGDLEREGSGLLTFIPEKVKVIENGKEVLLDNLEAVGKLVGNPKKGNKTGYYRDAWPEAISEKRKQEKPHWVWIKKEVIGRNKAYFQQQELIAKEENIKIPGAKISGLIDTAISVFMEYVRSGEQIFVQDPPVDGERTWVRVNEETRKYTLGLGFVPSGLDVNISVNGDRHAPSSVAVAPSRKSIGF